MNNHHVINGCEKIAVRDQNHLYKADLIASLKKGGVDIAFIRTRADKKNLYYLAAKMSKLAT